MCRKVEVLFVEVGVDGAGMRRDVGKESDREWLRHLVEQVVGIDSSIKCL